VLGEAPPAAPPSGIDLLAIELDDDVSGTHAIAEVAIQDTVGAPPRFQ
jgi:hypothetical protein